jgi:hypothetical protein
MYNTPDQTGETWKNGLHESLNQKLRTKLLNQDMLENMQEEAGLLISLASSRLINRGLCRYFFGGIISSCCIIRLSII